MSCGLHGAPYLAEAIHIVITNDETKQVNRSANLLAHTTPGALVAGLEGNSALVGGTGALAGEGSAQLMAPDGSSALSETQKQELSGLATLAGGVAGFLTGGRDGIFTGAQAGKNAAENNYLNGQDAEEKRGVELALSKTGQALSPKTPEEVAALEARHDALTKPDADIDSYVRGACSQGKSSAACQDANALAQGLQQSYEGYTGIFACKELNREDYARVSQLVAETRADKWDYAIENYAASQNISYQAAKDKFALVININQAADIAGILYGLKGGEGGKSEISSATASTLKQVLSKYDEFKQNIANSTKGNNDGLIAAGAGAGHTGAELPPNAHLSTGAGGKGNGTGHSGESAASEQALITDRGSANKGKSATVNNGTTGTVWDSIKATQPNYSGSVIPKSFEMTLPNGQKVWVHGNATEHIAEYAQFKAEDYTPEAVRLSSQQQLNGLQGALNTATRNGVEYNKLITIDGWELKLAPPRQPGELPAVIHAQPVK